VKSSTRAVTPVNNLPLSDSGPAKSRPALSECRLAARDLSLAGRLPRHLFLQAFAGLILILTPRASAQSQWNTTNGDRSAGANWSPAETPLSGNSTGLIFAGDSDYTATNDIGNFSLYELQFTNSAGTVTLNGSPATNALDFVNSSAPALPSITIAGAGQIDEQNLVAGACEEHIALSFLPRAT
jgi:hypothetical protein